MSDSNPAPIPPPILSDAQKTGQHKVVKLYLDLSARANALSMQITIDGSSFIISHAANKWPSQRKSTLQDLQHFIEGAESNKKTTAATPIN